MSTENLGDISNFDGWGLTQVTYIKSVIELYGNLIPEVMHDHGNKDIYWVITWSNRNKTVEIICTSIFYKHYFPHTLFASLFYVQIWVIFLPPQNVGLIESIEVLADLLHVMTVSSILFDIHFILVLHMKRNTFKTCLSWTRKHLFVNTFLFCVFFLLF